MIREIFEANNWPRINYMSHSPGAYPGPSRDRLPNNETGHTAYADRLRQWDSEKYDDAFRFNKQVHYDWSTLTLDQLSKCISKYVGKKVRVYFTEIHLGNNGALYYRADYQEVEAKS
jgi:hypothetical protein